jgi:hypothetical protein
MLTKLACVCFLFLLVSCGKPASPSKASLSGSRSCPLYFSAENLCAQIDWVESPKNNRAVSYTLTFFEEGSGPAEPKAAIESFVQMVCCKTVLLTKIERLETGKYSVSGPLFSSGKWDVFVRLGTQDQVAQVIVP